MFRLFILCFSLLLPLQFAWAGAASYCAHEASTGAEHFGHHTHVHASDSQLGAGGKFMIDTDCGTCHTAGSMLIASHVAAHAPPVLATHRATSPVLPSVSALARAPDRPQWRRLA